MNQVHLFKIQLAQSFFTQKKVYTVDFPKEWYHILQQGTTGYKRAFKLDQMGNKILSVQPNVIFHDVSDQALKGNQPWLYIVDPGPSLFSLELFVSTWLIDKAEEANIPLSVQDIHAAQNLASSLTHSPNALPVKTLATQKHLVSGLARLLYTSQSRSLTFDTFIKVPTKKNGKIHYTRTQTTKTNTLSFTPCFSSGIHEAVSEEIEFNGEFLSYVVSFDYQVEPLSTQGYLIVKVSNRRWMVKPKLSLSSTHSLFVQPKNQPHLLRFTIKKAGKGATFISKAEEEMFQFYVKNTFTLQDVLDDPRQFMNHPNFFVGIPYGENTFKGFSHNLGSGIAPQIRKAFLEQMMTDFPYYTFTPALSLLTKKGKQAVPVGVKTKDVFDFNKTTFYGSVEDINLVIWEDKRDIIDEIRSLLHTYDGVTILSQDDYILDTKNGKSVSLTLISKQKQGIDQQLSDDKKATHAAHKMFTKNVIQQEQLDGYGYSLIEMIDYSKVKSGGDPKKPVRQAFAEMEMKTQFIQPKPPVVPGQTDNFSHRVESSFFDVLTKVGFIKGINQLNTSVYAYHLLKFKQGQSTCYVPVLSKMTDDYSGYYFFDDQKWYPLQNVLTKMNKLAKNLPTTLDWKQTEKLLFSELQKDASDKVLIMPAELRNHHSSWEIDELKNENLSHSMFLLANTKNLSIVRMNKLSDVPTYLTFNAKGETTKATGIIAANHHLFYSIGAKPDTDQQSNNKLFTRYTKRGFKFQQRKALELVVLNNNPNTTEQQVVELVHNLRNLNISFNVHLSVDFTQYLIRHLDEYIS